MHDEPTRRFLAPIRIAAARLGSLTTIGLRPFSRLTAMVTGPEFYVTLSRRCSAWARATFSTHSYRTKKTQRRAYRRAAFRAQRYREAVSRLEQKVRELEREGIRVRFESGANGVELRLTRTESVDLPERLREDAPFLRKLGEGRP